MVQEALVDLITEIEAGWAVTAQMIRMFDRVHTYGQGSHADYALLRLLLSLAKYRCSELGVTAAKRALELHGGNGYIEEYVTPRLLRDAVVNPVWEGTANIQALEILKTLHKGGGQPFVADLRNALNAVDTPSLFGLKAAITAETDRVETLIAHVLDQEPGTQEAVAKKLADLMYDVYAAARLLEEASYDIQSTGDARRALAVEHWLRMNLQPTADRGILSGRVITDDMFRSLVMFAPFRRS
jgi:acyl-CoA dehydrogenase